MTDAAAGALLALLAEKSAAPGHGLRLSVERGGCAGLQYAMDLGPGAPGDLIVERSGARVFVDAGSAETLDGCSIDYEDGLAGAGFRIRNPNAARSCGCGTSFEPAPKTA